MGNEHLYTTSETSMYRNRLHMILHKISKLFHLIPAIQNRAGKGVKMWLNG